MFTVCEVRIWEHMIEPRNREWSRKSTNGQKKPNLDRSSAMLQILFM